MDKKRKRWKESRFLKGVSILVLVLSVFADTVAGMSMIAGSEYAGRGREKPEDFFVAGEAANLLLDGSIRLFEEYMQIGSLITKDGEIDYDKEILVSILNDKRYTIRELLKYSSSEGEAVENFRKFMADFLENCREGKSYPWYTRRALHSDTRVILDEGNIFQFASPNAASLSERKIENMKMRQENMTALSTDTQKYKETLGESISLRLAGAGRELEFHARSSYEGYLIMYFPEYARWYFLNQAVQSYENKGSAGRDDLYHTYMGGRGEVSEKKFYKMLRDSRDKYYQDLQEDKIPWSVHLIPRTMEEAGKYAAFLVETYQELQYYFSHSNFFYAYENSQGLLVTNRKKLWGQAAKEAGAEGTAERAADSDSFLYAYFDKSGDEGKTNFTRASLGMSGNVIEKLRDIGEQYKPASFQIAVGLDLKGVRTARYEDGFWEQYVLSNQRFHMYVGGRTVLFISGIASLLSFLLLAVMSGHNRESDGSVLGWHDRIWLEVQFAAGYIFVEMILWLFMLWNRTVEAGLIFVFAAAISLLLLFILGMLLSIIKRQKCHMGVRYSLILFFLSEVVFRRKNIGEWSAQIKRRAAFFPAKQKYALLIFLELAVLLYGAGCLVLVKFDEDMSFTQFLVSPFGIAGMAAAAILLLAVFIQQRQAFLGEQVEIMIIQGTKRIMEGDFSYQVPDADGAGERKAELIKTINQIGGVLEQAVEESVRNERLKTELIANVSHDIKTPLTSVINYVDLIKREQVDNETVQKYITVLERKSLRLKTLIEDLVEASKASSGVMELEICKLDFKELIRQTNGEFDDRFEECHLELISDLPDEAFYFEGDGRRVFRILENLYNNTAKYAMGHTRVYISLAKEQGSLVFTMKNISATKLNITPEELTERFVRGDRSRTTEGSGLGLSIAKSLTELMGGEFIIELDGDLFCAKVCFPSLPEG